MRVISKDEEERIAICECCNSKIGYKQEDTFFGILKEREIRCPVCKEFIKVSRFDRKVRKK